MEPSKLEATLAANGWQYDAERECFTDGARRIDYRRVLAVVPGMTMDDLAHYVNEKHEEWLAQSSREHASQFEVVQSGDQWVIRLPAAPRSAVEGSPNPVPTHLFWTGGTWRYNPMLAMKFHNAEVASNYIARCGDRMLVRSTFNASELRSAAMARDGAPRESS